MNASNARLLVLGVVALSGVASAQTSIDPVLKYCWTENAGWLNWRDANGGIDGVRDRGTCLSGYIWGEAVGWINTGAGPANGISYANVDNTNFGVNIDGVTGNLSGFAWGESIGWVNFSGGAMATPPNPARLDLNAGRFRGFAWGESIGWINLDDAVAYVKTSCYANCDGSSKAPILNVADFTCFLQKFALADPYANCDRSASAPVINVSDFTCFLQKFALGCP